MKIGVYSPGGKICDTTPMDMHFNLYPEGTIEVDGKTINIYFDEIKDGKTWLKDESGKKYEVIKQ